MKQSKTYGFVQDKNGTRYRVTSQAVASALKEANERVENLKVVAQRMAGQLEDARIAREALNANWWVKLGSFLRVVPLLK